MTPPEEPAAQTPEKPKRAGGGAKKSPEAPPVDPAQMLLEYFKQGNFELVAQTEEERSSRLRITEKDADHERDEKKSAMDHRRRVEIISLVAVLVIAGTVCPICLWVLCNDAISPERKAWASPLLTLIVGGLLGFLTGRIPGRPSDK